MVTIHIHGTIQNNLLFKLLVVYSLTYSMLEHPCKYNIANHFTSLSSAILLLMSLSSAIIILLCFLFRHFTSLSGTNIIFMSVCLISLLI
jgi:hypothetical protein